MVHWTKLDNCMKSRILFPVVLIDFPNSIVCLIGGPLHFLANRTLNWLVAASKLHNDRAPVALLSGPTVHSL